MPSELQVDKAIALIQKGGGNYEYFFEKLSSPTWIEPLAKRGRFNHPPALERVSGTAYRMPAWPEGHYLLRMAAFAPEAVAQAIGPGCFESDNPQVHSLLIEIASLLPASAARDIAMQELPWLAKQRSLYILYSGKAATLVSHLVEQGEIDAALRLTKTIFQVRSPELRNTGKPIELEDGTTYTYRPSPEPEGRMEPVWSQRYRSKVIPPLALAAGPAFLADLAENLNTAVTIHCSNHIDDPDDYSTIWRQFIDHNSHYGTLDEAVSAMTDAIKVLVEQIPGSEDKVVEILSRHKWPIFARLSAFALKTAPQVDAKVLADFVVERSRFPSPSANPEFRELLTEEAANLPPEVLETILRWVDDGPDPKSYEYHLTHRVRPENVQTVRASIIEQWQLDWLDALAPVLTGNRQVQLHQLRQRFQPSERLFRRCGGAVAVQEQSPTDLDSFNAMEVDEIVTYLKEWVPPASRLPFERPSRSGLGTTLSQWVSENPQQATEAIDRFLTTDIDPIYITSILDAFSALLKEKREFDVYAAAKAARWVAELTDALAVPEGGDSWGQATWNWAQMSAARFMTDLMLQTELLNLTRAEELFQTVRALCFVPRPTPEEEVEYKKEASRYASYALNTPRPVGVEALIRFGRWIRLSTPEKDFHRELLGPVFAVLDQKLDAAQEPSVAVREMLGMQFQLLAWLDLEWFNTVIPRLFPGKNGKLPAEKTLDRFAWNAYLLYGGLVLQTLPAMRNRYAAAIKSFQKGSIEVKETERTLASHLMRLYAHAMIELEDPLLVQFFESASPALRAQAIGDIGWSIGQDGAELEPTIQERLMKLLEHRLTILKEASREDGKELETFGWWVHCEKFSEAWTVEQAMRILEKQHCLSPDFAVAETFAKLASKYPYQAVRVVHVLLEEDRDGWSIHGWNEHLDAILNAALGDGDDAKKEAVAMIDLLATRGFRGYRTMLTGSSVPRP
jgi:hypothetical protein